MISRDHNCITKTTSAASKHLLEIIASYVDLCRSPVEAACMPLSDEHCLAESWSQSDNCDEQHDHLLHLLYLTLTSNKDVIDIIILPFGMTAKTVR
jgi:hypothetical protein